MDGSIARRRIRLVVIAAFVGLWTSPAVALPPELEYAKGVVAYSRGDLEAAEAHFSAVLEEQPENTQATYYLGQVALGLGKIDRAVDLFQRVARLSPDNPAVRLDLALALVKAGRFSDAERELGTVADRLSDRASLHYYLGFCRYKLGRHRQALEPLKRAREMDSGFAASAGYYLGLAHYELGEQAEAARQFQQLSGVDEGGRVGSLARGNLALMAEQSQTGRVRWWGAFASTGAGYDSNVTLERDVTSATGAPGAFVSIGGYLIPLRLERDRLEVSANVFRSFNITDDTKGLNLTDLASVVRYRHAFAAGHRLEIAYLFDLDMLDDLEKVGGDRGFGVFMQGHTGQARFRIREGRYGETALEYRFHWQLFEGAERDNFGHEFVVRQEQGFLAGRIRLALQVGGLYEDGRNQNWDLWGLLAGVEGRFQIIGPLSGWLRAGWRREDHYRWFGGERRVDDLWSGGVGLSVRLWDYLSLGASYRYLNNDSNGLSDNIYRYDRHLVNLAVMGRL